MGIDHVLTLVVKGAHPKHVLPIRIHLEVKAYSSHMCGIELTSEKGMCGEHVSFSMFINNDILAKHMDCRHTWLHMLRVDKNTTKIVCKECKQVMGFFKEEEVREPDFIRKTMKFSIRDNRVEIPSIAEFFEELMNEAKEVSLDRDILERLYSQNNQSGVSGKVRELSDEEREELR